MSIIIIPPSVRVDLSPILISENSRESLKAPLYSVLDTDTEGVSFHPYFCTFPECLQKCINRAKPKAKSQKVGHEEEVLKTGTDTSEQLRGERTGIKSELNSGDGKWRSMWDCFEMSCRPLVVVLLNIHATVKDTWKYAGSDDYCLKQTWAEMNLKEGNLIEVQYFYLYVSSSDLQRNTACSLKYSIIFVMCLPAYLTCASWECVSWVGDGRVSCTEAGPPYDWRVPLVPSGEERWPTEGGQTPLHQEKVGGR